MPTRFSIATVEAVKRDLDTLPEIERELREVGRQDAIRPPRRNPRLRTSDVEEAAVYDLDASRVRVGGSGR